MKKLIIAAILMISSAPAGAKADAQVIGSRRSQYERAGANRGHVAGGLVDAGGEFKSFVILHHGVRSEAAPAWRSCQDCRERVSVSAKVAIAMS